MHLFGQETLARLDLLESFAGAPERAEQLDDGDVCGLRERVDCDARAREHQRALRLGAASLHERFEGGDAQRARRLPLGDAPLVEPVAPGQVEAFEELAAERRRHALESLGRGRRGAAGQRGARLEQVDTGAARVEGHVLAVGDEPLALRVVDERPELGETPAQGGAGIVGPLPEQLAQPRAQLLARRDDEVAEEGSRLLRSGQLEHASVAHDLELAEQPDLHPFAGHRVTSIHVPPAVVGYARGMCRFLGYLGEPVPLEHFLYGPDNSLVKQAYDPTMLRMLNLGGMGVYAWDPASVQPERPFSYKTTSLPMFDPNLESLAAKVRPDAFVAHVRGVAYGPHAAVGPQNLHPFLFAGQRVALAHNGDLARFVDMRFDLAGHVEPDVAAQIRGSTDSEWIYALVVSELARAAGPSHAEGLGAAVVAALGRIREARRAHGIELSSSVNLLLCDGRSIVATRYCFDFGRYGDRLHEANLAHPSLWYTLGESYGHHDGEWRMRGRTPRSCVVASEPLTKDPATWIELPEDSLLIAERDGDRIRTRTLPIDA